MLLRHYRPVSTLAFCNTRQQCRDLVQVLREQGFHALALHGELEQRERDKVLIQFANRSCSVLVATDVAARGLDIAQLEAVINVDITPDPEVYIHRIGRTGRADQEGWALSLASPGQMRRVANIVKELGAEPEWHSPISRYADCPHHWDRRRIQLPKSDRLVCLRSNPQRIPHHFRHVLRQPLDRRDALQRGARMRLPAGVELAPAVEAARDA